MKKRTAWPVGPYCARGLTVVPTDRGPYFPVGPPPNDETLPPPLSAAALLPPLRSSAVLPFTISCHPHFGRYLNGYTPLDNRIPSDPFMNGLEQSNLFLFALGVKYFQISMTNYCEGFE
ncbi:hypothetical protein QLX08_010123 [Tetragonisca angustula]|uniref:Uncharacterized protein n=1 Tax=Tetragonisca angustula TaxID=166442 RepID=A0AAW0ZEQ6_9HYME